MTNINKTITLILLIVIVLAIIIFLVISNNHTEPIRDLNVTPLFEEYIPRCGVISNLLTHDQCTLNLSREAQSTELCHFISNEIYKSECYNITI